MKNAQKSRLFALLFVVLLAALLRYPFYPHEFGGDTLELHWYADELRDKGTQGFVMSPLSWFGLYPVSYSQGVPILGAVFGEAAGIPTDLSLAICGIFVGILGCLGYFLLGHRLTGRFAVGVVCAASLATSGFSVPQTIWGLSGRAMVQSFFPFALWAMVPRYRSGAEFGPRNFAVRATVLLVTNIAMAAAHRLFLLAVLTEVIVAIVLVAKPRIVAVMPERIRTPTAGAAAALVLVAGLLLYGAATINVGVRAGPAFMREFFVTSDQTLFILGYVLEFAYDTGPLFVLLAPALWAMFRGSSAAQWPIWALLLAFGAEFFLVVPSFSSISLAPIAGVLAGIGWLAISRNVRQGTAWTRRGSIALLTAVVLATAAFQGVFLSETQEPGRNPDGTSFYVDQESVESGIFLRHDTRNTTFITPDLTDSRRVASAGHVATVSSEALLFGADPSLRDKIVINYAFGEHVNLLDLTFYFDAAEALVASKTLYEARDWISGGGYGQGKHYGEAVDLQGSTASILDAYHVDHVLINNVHSQSRMTTLVVNNYYVEYQNSLETTFLIQHDARCLHGLRGCP